MKQIKRLCFLITFVCMACGQVPEYVRMSEDEALVVRILDAFARLGVPDPGYTVIFVYHEDLAREVLPPSCHPRIWKYQRGWCCYSTMTIYIRRFGPDMVEEALPQLVIHELAHAAGYRHGEEMTAFIGEVMAELMGT